MSAHHALAGSEAIADPIATPYLADLSTVEAFVEAELVPARSVAVEQIASIVADAHGAYRLEALLAPARELVAYIDEMLSFVAAARVGRADPRALSDAAEAVRARVDSDREAA